MLVGNKVGFEKQIIISVVTVHNSTHTSIHCRDNKIFPTG